MLTMYPKFREEEKMFTLLDKSAKKKRRPGKELLEALVENSFDLLALIDEDGKYLYVSESQQQRSKGKENSLLGYRPEDLIGKDSYAFMHPDDLPMLMQQFSVLFNGVKKAQISPYRYLDASGNWRWMEAIVTNQLDHPDIKAIVVSCRDVHQQVETEARLKELQALQALMEGEENERSRIARDLHDNVAGIIAAAKMHLTALVDQLNEVQAKKEFLQSLNLLDTAATQVRNTSHNLMPEILLENGLDHALDRYCKNISSDKITIDYVCLGSVQHFSPGFELSLYRILQELLCNVIKHSKASHAFVQLSFQEQHLSVTVEDDGRGFDLQQPTSGTGLKSVEKRVKALNGTMELVSEQGKGTSIYFEFKNF